MNDKFHRLLALIAIALDSYAKICPSNQKSVVGFLAAELRRMTNGVDTLIGILYRASAMMVHVLPRPVGQIVHEFRVGLETEFGCGAKNNRYGTPCRVRNFSDKDLDTLP